MDRITMKGTMPWSAVTLALFILIAGFVRCDGRCLLIGGSGFFGGNNNRPTERIPPSCNCNKSSDWNKDSYTINQVTYSIKDSKTHDLQPISLSEKDILNYSGERQSITIQIEDRLSQTFEFSNTGGIAIQIGVEFKVGIPVVAEGTVSSMITTSFSHTWGKSETRTRIFKGIFPCNGAPHKHTMCSVTFQNGRVSVPYTMVVKHKVIPDCTCESYGVWTSTQAYNANLIVKELGDAIITDSLDNTTFTRKEVTATIFL